MKIQAGQRVFTRSSITNEEFEYFLPSTISDIEAPPPPATLSPPTDDDVFLPHAAIVASRGRVMLSAETIEQARLLEALVYSWRGKSPDIASFPDLHAKANGVNRTRSTYRDSMVWVDGLRPVDAKLIPGPASTVLPLMLDYADFLRRRDIPALVKLAIAHYQILMIHPFFDGNGRLSRLLALINAQPVVGTSRAFAIVAVLAMHRRALRGLFHEARAGNLCNYLAYWEKVVAWSDVCVAQAAQYRELAMNKISQEISMFKSIQRLATFLIEAPLFTQARLASDLNLSGKLGLRYVDQLRKSEVIELHPTANGAQCFRCPTSVSYWRQVMENTASTSTQLLQPAAISSCAALPMPSQTPLSTRSQKPDSPSDR